MNNSSKDGDTACKVLTKNCLQAAENLKCDINFQLYYLSVQSYNEIKTVLVRACGQSHHLYQWNLGWKSFGM